MKLRKRESTVDDDRWSLNRMKQPGVTEAGTYRFADLKGVVHRAMWIGYPSPLPRWETCCGLKVVEKLQEGDAGAVTCVRCIGSGA